MAHNEAWVTTGSVRTSGTWLLYRKKETLTSIHNTKANLRWIYVLNLSTKSFLFQKQTLGVFWWVGDKVLPDWHSFAKTLINSTSSNFKACNQKILLGKGKSKAYFRKIQCIYAIMLLNKLVLKCTGNYNSIMRNLIILERPKIILPSVLNTITSPPLWRSLLTPMPLFFLLQRLKFHSLQGIILYLTFVILMQFCLHGLLPPPKKFKILFHAYFDINTNTSQIECIITN